MTEPYLTFCDTHYVHEFGDTIPARQDGGAEIECTWGMSAKRQRGAPFLFSMSIEMSAMHDSVASRITWYPTKDELEKLISLSNEMLDACDNWEKENGEST